MGLVGLIKIFKYLPQQNTLLIVEFIIQKIPLARVYALQTGIKIGKSPEERGYLVKLMDWLEKFKKDHADNEAITNEVAAQAHLENWILKIFSYADKQDRAGNFTKAVIQSFYTAGILYDIMATFGELSDEVLQNRKYAKWKATYIHNCLKNGETPIAGPIENSEGGAPAPSHQGNHHHNLLILFPIFPIKLS